jgi:hypothetical protein
MRFLKRQALDRRSASNTTLYSDAARANVYVSPVGQGSLVLPNGPTTSQPAGSTGMMRYDTTTNQVMVYQGTAWRALRYKESTGIVQQNLGNGNGLNTLFGPLAAGTVATGTYPYQIATGATFGPQNLLVIVENVLQVATTNYLITTGSAPVTETTVGTLANSGSTSLTLSSIVDINVGDTLTTAAPTTTINTTINTTTNTATYSAGGVTSTTMTVTGFTGIALVVGQKVTGTGFNNNQYLISVTSTGGGSYSLVLNAVANTQPSGTLTFDVVGASPLIGTNLLVASNAGITAGMYVNGIGFDSFQTVVSISGSYTVVLSAPPDSTPTGTVLFTSSAGSAVFAASTIVTSVNTATNVITINNATIASIAAGRAIQSTRPSSPSVNYIRFTSAVPSGKPVTVLSGFDQ